MAVQKRVHIGLMAVAVFLIGLAWWQLFAAGAGLRQSNFEQDGVPLRYVSAGAAPHAGVVVAHGFSGSRQIMLGYAYTLAHAGYGVMLLDFNGHGANTQPIGDTLDGLKSNLDVAYSALLAQPGIDPDRVAILGHSLGSGAAMRAAIEAPGRYQAVVAISPTDAAVSPTQPANLQLQAGELEAPFAARARALLAEAGGEEPDVQADRGRELIIVSGVEHISILFAPVSHAAALRWLDDVFGVPERAEAPHVDRRILWFGLHLLSVLLLWLGGRRWLPVTAAAPPPARRRWAVAAAPLLASVLLVGLGGLLPVGNLGGLRVGGGLALWLLLAGGLWLALAYRPVPPRPVDWLWGGLLFAVLWLAFGLMGQVVWLPWLLTAPRLLLWAVITLACLPWQWAAAAAQTGRSARARFWAWLGHSFFFCLSLAPTAWLVPGLGFLVLLLPLLPVMLAVIAVSGWVIDRPWPVALGGAAFFAWVVVVIFPLAS